MYYFMFFLGAYLLCFCLMPMVIKFGEKYLLDYPNKRKLHKFPKPRAGGIAIYTTLLMLSTLMGLDYKLFIPLTFIFLVGLVDDFLNIPAMIKLLCQTITGIITVAVGINITSVYILGANIELGQLSYIFTVLWFVGVMNAFNLIDGLDGLSGGSSLVSGIFLLILAIITSNSQAALLLLITLGATLGFLQYNLPPSKAFLGDSGSLTLGFILALVSSILMVNAPLGHNISLVGIIMIMFVPILDTSWAIVRRMINQKAVMKADKGHIHHVLYKTFKSDTMILIAILTWGLFIGLFGLLLIVLDTKFHSIFLTTVTIISAFTIYNLTKIRQLLSFREIAVTQSEKKTKWTDSR